MTASNTPSPAAPAPAPVPVPAPAPAPAAVPAAPAVSSSPPQTTVSVTIQSDNADSALAPCFADNVCANFLGPTAFLVGYFLMIGSFFISFPLSHSWKQLTPFSPQQSYLFGMFCGVYFILGKWAAYYNGLGRCYYKENTPMGKVTRLIDPRMAFFQLGWVFQVWLNFLPPSGWTVLCAFCGLVLSFFSYVMVQNLGLLGSISSSRSEYAPILPTAADVNAEAGSDSTHPDVLVLEGKLRLELAMTTLAPIGCNMGWLLVILYDHGLYWLAIHEHAQLFDQHVVILLTVSLMALTVAFAHYFVSLGFIFVVVSLLFTSIIWNSEYEMTWVTWLAQLSILIFVLIVEGSVLITRYMSSLKRQPVPFVGKHAGIVAGVFAVVGLGTLLAAILMITRFH